MSRISSMNPEAIKALFSTETGSDIITLVTITGTDVVNPFESPQNNSNEIRLCDSYVTRLDDTGEDIVYGLVSNSKQYVFLPLEITLPQEDEAQAPRCTIVIRDVTRYLTPIIRNLKEPPKVKLELIVYDPSNSSSLDTVEVSFDSFSITNFTYNRDQVTAELQMVNYEREPFPMHSFSPKYFPGLF